MVKVLCEFAGEVEVKPQDWEQLPGERPSVADAFEDETISTRGICKATNCEYGPGTDKNCTGKVSYGPCKINDGSLVIYESLWQSVIIKPLLRSSSSKLLPG